MAVMLESLLDVQNILKEYLLNLFNTNLIGLIGYGSFFRRDLTTPISELSLEEFEDKKPDFILLVRNYPSFYDILGDELGWDRGLKELSSWLNRFSMNYYNLKILRPFSFETMENGELTSQNKSLRYKIAVVSFDDARRLSSYDFYLSGRLSKSISVLYIEKEREEELEKILENIRRRFIAISFGLQSGMFTLEELIRSYIAISYLAEIYRYWTIDRRKPDEIYDSVFSTEHGVKPVKEMLREELSPFIEEYLREYSEKVRMIDEETFIRRGNPLQKYKLFLRFLVFSLKALIYSIKTGVTNRYGNDEASSSVNYMKRKIRKMFK